MTEQVSSYINLCVDEAKLLRKIRNYKDCKELQNYISKKYEWSKTLEIRFNEKTCHILEMGKSEMRPTWIYKLEYHTISIEKKKRFGSSNTGQLITKETCRFIFGDTIRMARNIRTALDF